jgi:hypothetical protein
MTNVTSSNNLLNGFVFFFFFCTVLAGFDGVFTFVGPLEVEGEFVLTVWLVLAAFGLSSSSFEFCLGLPAFDAGVGELFEALEIKSCTLEPLPKEELDGDALKSTDEDTFAGSLSGSVQSKQDKNQENCIIKWQM